jgi:osmotically-inducible protein OsmY
VAATNDITIEPKVDLQAVSDITHALHRSWFFDPKTISVMGEDGKIRLTGTVHTPHERKVAAATAWAAPGVIDVQNELQIV